MPETELNRDTVRKIIFILCVTVLFYAAITHLGTIFDAFKWVMGIVLPIIIGFAVAFIMSPFAQFFEDGLTKGCRKPKIPPMKQKPARILSVVIAFLLVVAAVSMLIVIIIPEIRSAVPILLDTVPGQVRSAVLWVDETAESFGLRLELQSFGEIDWAKIFEPIRSLMANAENGSIFTGFIGAASSVVSVLLDLGLGAIIGFHLVIHKENVGRFFIRALKAYLPEKRATGIINFVSLCSGAFRSFMTGQLLEACALGILCCIGMFIFRFPYAVAVSFVMGFTALIPIFGAWMGGILGALMALTDSPLKALLFVVFIIALQAIDNTFIYPRIVGNATKLEALLVMVAVIVGGSMFGVTGMILGVPAMSVIDTLLSRDIATRLEAKGIAAADEAPPEEPPKK
ncbi:MAG: AI-2E family transporter [Oscillospiraceae bacterium]|nr:AI-2E family transporter [Oscillospiraceae bacterium]